MDNSNVEVAAGGGATGSSRWNPTKEQISMLENLYGQGIRTPSAEQIQQITGRLKAYGHIEGKNVFYWFQNHKARQRQKQKQEDMVYINRYIHNPPCPNVVCGPYYMQQGGVGFYPQYHHKVLLHGGVRRRPRPEKLEKTTTWVGSDSAEYALPHPEHHSMILKQEDNYEKTIGNTNQETLALFPLHPTGLLERRRVNSASLDDDHFAASLNSTNSPTCIEGSSSEQQLFDFFSGKGRDERF